jgi:hypothetical protein
MTALSPSVFFWRGKKMVSLVPEAGVGKRISLGRKAESVADVQAVNVSNMTMNIKHIVLFIMVFSPSMVKRVFYKFP